MYQQFENDIIINSHFGISTRSQVLSWHFRKPYGWVFISDNEAPLLSESVDLFIVVCLLKKRLYFWDVRSKTLAINRKCQNTGLVNE